MLSLLATILKRMMPWRLELAAVVYSNGSGDYLSRHLIRFRLIVKELWFWLHGSTIMEKTRFIKNVVFFGNRMYIHVKE